MPHQPSNHQQPHARPHTHQMPNISGGTMGAAVAITVSLVAIEAVCGWFGRSLALLSDAGHNLADAGALGFSWYAVSMSNRPSHEGMTFGYHRVGVFAALVNSVSLVGIALLIGWEAATRIRQPEASNGGLMMAVAATAIVVNVVIGFWLHRGSKDDWNGRNAH